MKSVLSQLRFITATATSWQIDVGGAVICIVLTLAAYFIAARPMLNRRDEQEATERSLAEARESATMLVSNTRSLRTQLTNAQTALETLEIQLKPAGTVNQRIAEITNLAGECGLEVEYIQPGKLVLNPRYGTLPIQVSGRGSYRRSAHFLSKLREKFPDTGVKNFELSSPQGDASASINFNFLLNWFVLPTSDNSRR